MQCFRRLSLAASLLLSILGLGACGSGRLPEAENSPLPGQNSAEELPQGINQAALPVFPPTAAPSPFRRVSDTQVSIEGADNNAEEGDNNYTDPLEPSKYVLVPGGDDDLAWAQYTWTSAGVEMPGNLTIEVSSAPLLPGGDDDLPLSYWIGLSNYSEASWEWQGPYDQSHSLSLNSQQIHEDYTSAAGDFSYVVLVWGGGASASAHGVSSKHVSAAPVAAARVGTCLIDTLSVDGPSWVKTRPPHTPITNIFASQGSLSIEWEHVVSPGPGPDINAAESYEVRRLEVGSNNIVLLGSLPAPGGAFNDPLDNQGAVAGPVSGKRYRYILSAINSAGTCSRSFSPAVGIDGAPVAKLKLTPGFGSAPLYCELDGIESFDPDGGSIDTYEWDLDGDGSFELNTSTANLTHKLFLTPGSHTVAMKVTDNDGNSDVALRNVIVSGWAHSLGGTLDDELYCAAFDAQGNVYAGGSIENATESDALLVQYAPDGQLLGARHFGGPASDEAITSISIGPSGDIYVGGSSSNPLGTTALAGRIRSTGAAMWTLQLGDFTGNCTVESMGLDSSEQFLYLAVQTESSGNSGKDIQLSKINCNTGNPVWSRSWSTMQNEFVHGLTINGNDEIYLGGSIQLSGQTEALLLKYNAQGQLQWTRQWGTSGFDEFTSLDCDSLGDVLIAGFTDGIDGMGDILLVKYSPQGAPAMQKVLDGGQQESTLSMCVDELDRIVVMASAQGYSSFEDSLLLVFNSIGNPSLMRRFSLDEGNNTLYGVSSEPGHLSFAGKTTGMDGNWYQFPGSTAFITGTLGTPNGTDASVTPQEQHPTSTIADVLNPVLDSAQTPFTDGFVVSTPFK